MSDKRFNFQQHSLIDEPSEEAKRDDAYFPLLPPDERKFLRDRLSSLVQQRLGLVQQRAGVIAEEKAIRRRLGLVAD